MSFDCEFCQKTYQTISSLNHHKKTSKKCLKLQEEKLGKIDIKKFICIHCNKDFLVKSIYEEHIKQCKLKKELYNKDLIEELNKLHDELKLQEEKHKKELTTFETKYKKEINIYKSIINNSKDENIKLKTQLECKTNECERLEKKLEKIKRINTKDNIIPLNKEYIIKQAKEIFSTNDIKNGIDKLINNIITILKNKYIMTDKSRSNCIYIDENYIEQSCHINTLCKIIIKICKDILTQLCSDSFEEIKNIQQQDNRLYNIQYKNICDIQKELNIFDTHNESNIITNIRIGLQKI